MTHNVIEIIVLYITAVPLYRLPSGNWRENRLFCAAGVTTAGGSAATNGG